MNERGYIIPITLILISMAVLLVTSIYRRGSVYVPFMTTMLQQEKARQLAMSGVQIAMSQLSTTPKSQKEKKVTELERSKKLLNTILPALNRWQEFKLTKAKDGIDGEIKIALSAEDGKIDLNDIFDFKKGKFKNEGQDKGDWKKIMQVLFSRMKKELNSDQNFFEPFEKLLKERQYSFNDASELLTLEPFRVFAGKVFYEPAQEIKQGKRAVYLMDIFTTYGSIDKLQPWLLSESIQQLFGIKRSLKTKKRKEMVKSWLEHFSKKSNWQQEWNKQLKPIYGIELQSLPNGLDSVLDEKFDPRMFSVVSYGKVGEVTQRAYAIIQRVEQKTDDAVTYDCKIKKFYWI